MAFKVLIVDDSGFFRRRLVELINSTKNLTVAGVAANGREAIDQVLKLKPDVITMDYEMPVMDGITAVRHIMGQCPTPILMFSSLTYEGARVTLDSLDAGAVDFLPKNFEEISKNSPTLRRTLEERLIMVAQSKIGGGQAPKKSTPAPASLNNVSAPKPKDIAASRTSISGKKTAPVNKAIPKTKDTVEAPVPTSGKRARRSSKPIKLVAIGTSTGGPVALQNVLTGLPANYPVPIILIQHMPSTFTNAFAQRLNSLCQITVKEAVDGDVLKPGVALLAPGGKQMMVVKGGRVKVLPGDERLNYKPSVDVAFGSAANVFEESVLAIVLTGMGTDGCEGAKILKRKGASIWAQDENTSVIYGMPLAVVKANIADEVLPLQNFSARLCEVV